MYMGMPWEAYCKVTTAYPHTGDIYRDVASMLRTNYGYDPLLNRYEIQANFGLSYKESERLIDAYYAEDYAEA